MRVSSCNAAGVAGGRRVGGRRTPGDQVAMVDLDRPSWGLPMATMLARTCQAVNTFDKLAKTSRETKVLLVENVPCSQVAHEYPPASSGGFERCGVVKARKKSDPERSSRSKVSRSRPIVVDACRERRSPPGRGQEGTGHARLPAASRSQNGCAPVLTAARIGSAGSVRCTACDGRPGTGTSLRSTTGASWRCGPQTAYLGTEPRTGAAPASVRPFDRMVASLRGRAPARVGVRRSGAGGTPWGGANTTFLSDTEKSVSAEVDIARSGG